MAVSEGVRFRIDPVFQARAKSIVENTHCPCCGKKLSDVTYEFHQELIGDISNRTLWYVVSTDVPYAVGECRRNCHYTVMERKFFFFLKPTGKYGGT